VRAEYFGGLFFQLSGILDSVEVKIDLCGLDSCHDPPRRMDLSAPDNSEDQNDDESYPGAKDGPPVGGQLRAFMACRKKEHSLYLQQQVKENNLTWKQFSQEKEVDLDRQVQRVQM
jgi:hypothetical protein